MSKKHPRHLLVLSTTTILTLLLSAPAFAADGGACLRDPSGTFVDQKGNLLNEERVAECLAQLAPAAGDDDGGGDDSGESDSDDGQNGDYDNDVPGTPDSYTPPDNETPPDSETPPDDETPPDNETPPDDETPPDNETPPS